MLIETQKKIKQKVTSNDDFVLINEINKRQRNRYVKICKMKMNNLIWKWKRFKDSNGYLLQKKKCFFKNKATVFKRKLQGFF